MKRKRDFIITNILSALVLLAALLAGWREAALFGLAVLVIMDLLAVLGERWPRHPRPLDEDTQVSEEDGQERRAGTDPDPEHVKPDA
jgi:dolichol kinase